MGIRIKLIAQWRCFWRFWSVRLHLIATGIIGSVAVSPEIVRESWEALPAELKNLLPPNYIVWIGVGISVLGIMARIVKQSKLPTGEDNGRL